MNGTAGTVSRQESEFDSLNLQLKQSKKYASFHGDALIGVSEPRRLRSSYSHISLQDVRQPTGFLASWRNSDDDFRRILFNPKIYPALAHILSKYLITQTLDVSGPPASLGKVDDQLCVGETGSRAHCGPFKRQQPQGRVCCKSGQKQIRKDATPSTHLSRGCLSIPRSRRQV